MNPVQNSSAGPSSRGESDFAVNNLKAIVNFKKHVIDNSGHYSNSYELSDLIEGEDVEGVENALSNPSISISEHQVGYLQMAMKTRNREIFDLLLQKELNLSPTTLNADLFVFALEMGNRDGDYFAIELAKRGFNPNPELEAIQKLFVDRYEDQGSTKRIKLLAKHLRFLSYNDEGNNPLQQAIKDRDLDEFNRILARDGVILDAYNRQGHTALGLAFRAWSRNPSDPNGLLMVRALLEKGANPNQKGTFGENFWDLLINSKPPGWDKVMAEFYKEDARFSTQFFQKPKDKIDGLAGGRSKTLYKEQVHRKAMATIFGIEFEDEIGSSSTHRNGGAQGWEVIDYAMEGVGEFSCSDPSMKQEFKKLKKAMRLAQSLSYYEHHYDKEWDQAESKESLWKQAKEAFAEGYPVMIPATLDGHLISIIFYQDQVMICNRGYSPTGDDVSGIHIYEWTKPLTKELFFDLISEHDESDEVQFLNSVHQKLGLVEKHVVQFSEQKHENCVWASSMAPGMKAILLALRLDGSFEDIDENFEAIKPFAKELTHYIRFHMVDTYVKSMFKFMRKTGEEPSYAMLGKLVKKLVYKIESKKDSEGLYKRALDAIIFSGASLSIKKNKQEELTERLARIYNVKPDSLRNNYRFV